MALSLASLYLIASVNTIAPILIGQWYFSGIIYRGDTQPRPNPALIMSWDFDGKQNNILRYERTGEEGFCERTATYIFDGTQLHQEIIDVNPENASMCSTDKDMQMGTVSDTPLRLENDVLYLTLGLGDEDMVLIWRRKIAGRSH